MFLRANTWTSAAKIGAVVRSCRRVHIARHRIGSRDVGGAGFPTTPALQPLAQGGRVNAQNAANVLEGEHEGVPLPHDPVLGLLKQFLLAGIVSIAILPVAIDRLRQYGREQLALAVVAQRPCARGLEELHRQNDLGLKQVLLVPPHAGVMAYRVGLVYA